MKISEHFLPTDYEQLIYTKLFSIKQDRKSIEEYIAKLHELSIQNQVWESDSQLTTCYKAKLQTTIQLEIIVAHYYSMDDVYQLALK